MIFILLLIISCFVFDDQKLFVESRYLSDLSFKYSVATYSKISNTDCVLVGDLKIYEFDSCFKPYSIDAISEMVEISLSDFLNKDNFKRLKRVMVENVEGIEFIYLYDASLPKILYLGNLVFNLQVAIKDNVVKIGYPCIVDSV